jgi:hypothetical protein
MGKIPLVVFAYDTGLRLTSVALTRASDNTLLYQTQPAYDAANNVVSVQTSIAGATDTQQFCYDALNRLTWGGSKRYPTMCQSHPWHPHRRPVSTERLIQSRQWSDQRLSGQLYLREQQPSACRNCNQQRLQRGLRRGWEYDVSFFDQRDDL